MFTTANCTKYTYYSIVPHSLLLFLYLSSDCSSQLIELHIPIIRLIVTAYCTILTIRFFSTVFCTTYTYHSIVRHSLLRYLYLSSESSPQVIALPIPIIRLLLAPLFLSSEYSPHFIALRIVIILLFPTAYCTILESSVVWILFILLTFFITIRYVDLCVMFALIAVRTFTITSVCICYFCEN